MSHTPGPWQWQDGESEGGDLVSLSAEEEALADEDGAPFPKWLHICTNAFDLGNPDDLSLIAAAPSLLALLERAVRSEHSETYMAWDPSQRPDWCKEAEDLLVRLGVKP